MRKIRRAVSGLLVLLLAVSLCTSAAAAETADEKSAVLDWLGSFGLPVSILEKLELTEEQLGALRSIFRTEDESPEPPEEELTVYKAALRLLDGELGTDEECRARLEAAGLDYWSVRHMANALQSGYDQVAQDVIDGLYGNQAARFRALEQSGYDARLVQQIVNGMLDG